MNVITLKTVKDKYGSLLCMSAHKVKYKNITFRTCEALFQYLRFDGHPEVQQIIFEQKSPLAAKMKARKYKELLNRGKTWDQSDSDIGLMKFCLKLKFKQNPKVKDILLNTESAVIIEDCTTHDRESARFWGMIYKNDQWIGENILGKLLMEIRDEYRK